MTELPIGVFDSGVGGLTVLRRLAEYWPGEKFLYLADTARLPYGTKSPETIEHYLVQNMKYLLKEGVKAIVVACNTASTVLLQKKIPAPVPLFNVIQPGAKAAVEATRTGQIGVMGTRATVLSEAYPRAVQALRADVHVAQQACPLLVPLIEEGWTDDPLTNMVIFRYIQNLTRQTTTPLDTLILGCTHYPVLKPAIQNVAGPDIQLVDSTGGLIAEMEERLQLARTPSDGGIRLVCTDLTRHLENLMTRLLAPLLPGSIEVVDL